MTSIVILLVYGWLSMVASFQPAPIGTKPIGTKHWRELCMKLEGEERKQTATKKGWNPLANLSDIFANVDDVIDDFMGKRMGNGELFYGKRKNNPSGRVNMEGDYNGMGYSDPLRIERARQRKEEALVKKRLREEADSKK
jgi:hypothetical protein